MAEKRNNFTEKKEVRVTSESSMLNYRAPLDPLTQTDELATQDRLAGASGYNGILITPRIKGQLYFISPGGENEALAVLDQFGLTFFTQLGIGMGRIFGGGTDDIQIDAGGGGVNFQFVQTTFQPTVDGAADLGSSSFQWGTIYLVNAPVVSSDRRWKNEIRNTDYGLDAVMHLRPVSFTRDGSDQTHIGFIAQETKEIVPEVVHGSEESGYSMAYEELIPVLTKAIQELKAEVDTLRKEMQNSV